jgi:hypothetical protein
MPRDTAAARAGALAERRRVGRIDRRHEDEHDLSGRAAA